MIMLVCPEKLPAQGQNNNWYFGTQAALDFNSGTPVSVSGSAINTTEGCASISDAAGSLLFYTDGVLIWNRNNQVMNQSSTFLLGSPSSTQSAIIVPMPGSGTQYYVFTADQGGYFGPNQGVHYSVVDMTLNGGLGGITTLNTLLLAPPATEKLSACRHNNCTDYWVITHSFGDNQFQAFQVTANGILPPVLSNVGTPHLNNSLQTIESIGYLKISPNRQRLAVTVYGLPGFAEVFDFDASTGIVSNPLVTINANSQSGVEGFYGLSFSPNSNLLYVAFAGIPSQPNALFQFDLSSGTSAGILASQQTIAVAAFSATSVFGALQLGPDGKIYLTNYTNQLDAVNNPDVPGAGCNFQSGAVTLSFGSTTFGLPNLIDDGGGGINVSLGNDTVFCGGAVSLQLSAGASSQFIYNWSTGSTAQNINVSAPGLYSVTITDTVCNASASDSILVSQLTLGNYPGELFSCATPAQISPLLPIAPGSSIVWNTGDTVSQIQVSTPGIYTVNIVNGSCIINDTVQVDFGISGSTATLNVFTPNGDGINDVFAFPTAVPEGFDLEIFSRWGNSLYRSSSPAQGWDGTFNSSAAEEGVYYWRLRTTDCFGNPEEKAGFVSLMR
ncbi:MAG: gliding motility-associated C-terminal domain-containing protein [Bacteroidia bacterium]|nr:gliding motility-associated C-terminal domain-containing protein [Bacteroidia bacterium]